MINVLTLKTKLNVGKYKFRKWSASFLLHRMASATILQSLKARADLADKIIGELRRQISAIKTATGNFQWHFKGKL